VALPVEHGGWGFLVEPVVLGLALAPSWAGACLALAALFAFLVRHPLRLALMDRRRAARYPRTAAAERLALGYLVLALVFLLLALLLARVALLGPLLLAAPAALLALVYDIRGRSREALPEAAGAVALGASTTAIGLAGGLASGPAFGAWILLGLRAVPAVLYVRARLRLDRRLPAGRGLALGAHGLAIGGAAALAVEAWGPWLAVVALALLLVRASLGLSSRRPRLRPRQLGLREMGWGLLTLMLLVVGYRGGL
jgi:hypothetical protein